MTPEAQRLATYAEGLLREAYRASRRGDPGAALAHTDRAAAMLRQVLRLEHGEIVPADIRSLTQLMDPAGKAP